MSDGKVHQIHHIGQFASMGGVAPPNDIPLTFSSVVHS